MQINAHNVYIPQHPWMATGAAGHHGGLAAKHAITEQE